MKLVIAMLPILLASAPLDAQTLSIARSDSRPVRQAPADNFTGTARVDTLFETQDKWAVAKDWRGALEKLVRLAGIGKKEFDACLGNKAIEDQVAQSRLTAAQQLGVNSTPTFFINGKKYEGEPTVEAFERVLSGLAAKS